MAAANFERALRNVLRHEGGFSNHPRDPGGATMKGVTQRVYDGYRSRKGLAKQSVRHITDAEIRDIYKRQYWDRIEGDDLPSGVDYCVFDGAVNSGPAQSVKWLQRSLGSNDPDPTLGEMTLDRIRNYPDHDMLVAGICGRRMAFLKALRTWDAFGKGWTRRVQDVKKIGQLLADGSVGERMIPEAEEIPAEETGKATINELPDTKGLEDAGKTSGGGAIVTETLNQIQPYADYSQYIRYVVVALLIVSAGVAIYALWRRRRNAKAREGELIAPVEGI